MSMSIHDALVEWQAGNITARRAMTLTGATDVLELYGLMESCGVPTRFQLTEKEMASVERANEAIKREIAKEGKSGQLPDPRSGF